MVLPLRKARDLFKFIVYVHTITKEVCPMCAKYDAQIHIFYNYITFTEIQLHYHIEILKW